MKKTNYYNNYYKKSHKNNIKEYKKPETTLCSPVIENNFNYWNKMLISKPIPELTFTEEAWLKIKTYIELIGDYEIGGLGRVVDGNIIDIKILKQTVETAYYNSSEQSVVDFIREIPREQINEWCLDWHSHVNMGVSPSSTDYDNYEKIHKIDVNKPFPALIINKKNVINGFTCFGDDVYKKTNIRIPVLEKVTEEQYLNIYNECYNEIMDKCTIKKYTYSYTGYGQVNYGCLANKSKSYVDEINYCTSCGTVLIGEEFNNNGLYCDDCTMSDNSAEYSNYYDKCILCGEVLNEHDKSATCKECLNKL